MQPSGGAAQHEAPEITREIRDAPETRDTWEVGATREIAPALLEGRQAESAESSAPQGVAVGAEAHGVKGSKGSDATANGGGGDDDGFGDGGSGAGDGGSCGAGGGIGGGGGSGGARVCGTRHEAGPSNGVSPNGHHLAAGGGGGCGWAAGEAAVAVAEIATEIQPASDDEATSRT